jgi:ribosomal protein S18 acetylase RimI-like enzyme
LDRIADIDATEGGTFVYRYEAGRIVKTPEEWHRPRWSEEQVRHHTEAAAAVLEAGGSVFGAFDGDLLVGFATLRPDLEPGTAQLADLQVSLSHRRRGIALRLVAEVLRGAREAGASRVYVSACPSESAVGLYESLGFEVAQKVHPELFALEPEDIHMTLDLAGAD